MPGADRPDKAEAAIASAPFLVQSRACQLRPTGNRYQKYRM